MGDFAYSNYNSTRRVEITQKKERGNLTGRVHSTCRGGNGPRMHHVIIARWEEPAPKRKRLFSSLTDADSNSHSLEAGAPPDNCI